MALNRLQSCSGWFVSLVFTSKIRLSRGIHLRNWLLILCECSKPSKISNTFLFRFPNEKLVITPGIHIMLVGKANREDPDLTVF